MSHDPKPKKRIKLWQLLLAIAVIGGALAWLLTDFITLP